MILPILIEPNPLLHQKTQPIRDITPDILSLVEAMRETMHNAQGIGLAAPQVGRDLSLCIVEFPSEDSFEHIPFLTLINPRITWRSDRLIAMDEACLSIPGVEGPVRRPDRVRVKAKDLQGQTFEVEAKGLLARVLQHEIDHLQGVLFTDYLKKKDLVTRPLVDYPTI